jgi:hypothetical protein
VLVGVGVFVFVTVGVGVLVDVTVGVGVGDCIGLTNSQTDNIFSFLKYLRMYFE